MHTDQNIFGEGSLFDDHDLNSGKVYFSCCACMSIYAEALSWANQYPNQVVKDPEKADIIVVLSCQITDLAVLNDIRMMEKYMEDYPGKRYFIGGCLARRFDIPLPKGVGRLDYIREDLVVIRDKSLVHFEKPFWVPGFKESKDPLSSGNLFRNKYPLRISEGCTRKCSCCTIQTTRGQPYEINPRFLWKEMCMSQDILLIADSPSVKQLKWMITFAVKAEKKISIRNVEPHVTHAILPDLLTLAQKGLLDTYHTPIQSYRIEVLEDMNRNAEITIGMIPGLQLLRKYGVKLATNVIIDYKNFLNPDWGLLKEKFDYVSWNPYWDGCWNRDLAEVRFERYIKK
jgi:tRNA A37 methylthiotransferase MiaB